MGRQSLQIQPQPEPRFITEYKKKKELHRKTQGNIFLYDFSEETTNGSDNGSLNMSATPDILKEVKEVILILTVYFGILFRFDSGWSTLGGLLSTWIVN